MDTSLMTTFLISNWHLVAIAGVTGLLLYFRQRTPPNLPPGPFSLPVLGTLPFLGIDIREPLRRLGKKYGDVFTVYFGARRVIILNSYDVIKEAFVGKSKDAMSGRPQDFFWVEHITEGRGVVSTQGPVWREQRRFAHRVLREMGVGTTLMEDKIKEEVSHFIHALEEKAPGPCDPSYIIQCAVANIIHSVIFGRRCKYDDPQFIKYIDIMNANFEVLGNAGALAVFPSLKYLPGDYFQYHRLMETSKYMKDKFREEVRASHAYGKDSPGDNESNDFIEAYLKVIHENKEKGIESDFSEDQLVGVIGDLFGAGTETTTSTLRWALTYLLHNPDVQKRVQEEIDDVIGSHRMAKMEDRSQMPYTEACLHEIQRVADIVPLGVPHCTTEEVKLKGYTIPEGTTVMPHLYAVHRDPNLWADPDRFDPTRFLDADGKLHRPETLIPFSMGKRVCLGESLARMELFLMFTGLVQHFTFSLPPGNKLPPLVGRLSVTHMPSEFEVMITRR